MFRVLPLLIILLSATPAAAKVFVAQDGTYVGGLPGFQTGSAKVKGVPSVDKNGFYLDGTVTQTAKKETWKKIKEAIELKLSPATKTGSKE